MIVQTRVAMSVVLLAVVIATSATPILAQTQSDGTQPTTPATPSPPNESAVAERMQKQRELVATLIKEHGYKLGDGEPFKFIKDPQNKERNELRQLMQSSMPVGGPAPKTPLDTHTPFTHVLYVLPDGRIVSSSLGEGVTTLGDVFEWILKVMPYEFECPANLLNTYMPGDWLILTEEGRRPIMSDGAPPAHEKALNDECGLNVQVEWKMVERPVLVVRGRYVPKPAGDTYLDKVIAAQADGTFLVGVRRALSYHPPEMEGDFDQFIDSIGYLLMLPVVNEAETRPTKKLLTWHETGKYIEGNERLPSDKELRVLESLHEQLGYDLAIEPREVRLLSIEPVVE
jgi:hypothetical protein